MACILKLPSKKSKGVISFTSIEYFSQIYKINHTQKLIKLIKDNWIVCYHPNWEDMNFQATEVFDVVMSNFFAFKANNKELITPIIDTSCVRMSPSYFKMQKQKKWDFFHVSRYEPRKNIPGFFKVIKSAFKNKKNLNGILLISVQPQKLKEVRNLYNNYFTEKEREKFELVTLDYDLPFPLSKKLLAHLYNSSKVSLNTHLDEPHGRVVGYSLASGLPVVGFKDLTRMVPKDLRQEPFFFVTEDQNELSNLLIKAIDYVDSEYRHNSHEKISNLHSEVEQSIFLKNQLTSMFNLDNDGWFLDNLDLRLSSHFLYDYNTNTFNQSILDLLYYILQKNNNLSFLSSTENYKSIESKIVSQIDEVKFYKPLRIKLLDYIIGKVFLLKGFWGKTRNNIKRILPDFIVKMIKRNFLT